MTWMKRLTIWEVVFLVFSLGIAWTIPAKHGYSGWPLAFAVGMTALLAIGLVRRLRRH